MFVDLSLWALPGGSTEAPSALPHEALSPPHSEAPSAPYGDVPSALPRGPAQLP